MTVVNFNYPKFKYTIATTGQPGVGYKLFTYEEGTSTKKTTWTSLAKTAANTNPIILDANGECDVWIDGNYKFVLAPPTDTDPPASAVWTYDAIRSDGTTATTTASATSANPINGSFETDSNSDGTPDNWTLTSYSGGTTALDTTSSSHGDTSLKFTSTGSGGGQASTDDYYEVEAGKILGVNFSIISADATTLNKVQVYWYNAAQTFLSSSDAYNNGTTNPTSWTRQYTYVTSPATAKYARIVITGIDPTSTTHSNTTFDNIEIVTDYNTLLKSVTITPAGDSDHTLSGLEYNSSLITWATGAWTQARNGIVPAEYRGWAVVNNGTYAVTIKTASGTGVVILPGTSRYVVCDGTNVVDPLTHYVQRDIQPITASVGASALTITLNPTILDFRSSSLTSGTVNRRSIPSAISVVVSSGSTLGTVSAVQSRLVVLAIDNSGTVELAVVNIAGGNNLDETTLISTTAEGGSGTADSASTIYSTTARTNVPFRVVGIIESTQATAGTWATAPSTIQGVGGNAIAAMSSVAYGQTWQDLTASRANEVTYYNTTGKPIVAMITNSFDAAGTIAIFQIGGVEYSRVTDDGSRRQCVTLVIPPGNSYKVTSGGGTLTLYRWSELR